MALQRRVLLLMASITLTKSLGFAFVMNIRSALQSGRLLEQLTLPAPSLQRTAFLTRLALDQPRPTNRQPREFAMNGSFRTEVDVPRWPEHTVMGYGDSFFLLGSCFSDNVGERLARAKLKTAVNPSHGLLFSPLSAAASLDRMVSGTPYSEDEEGVVFSEGKGLWCSLDHHSTFSSSSRYQSVMIMCRPCFAVVPPHVSNNKRVHVVRISCTLRFVLRGTIVNRTNIVGRKIANDIGYCVYRRSYLIWPPVILLFDINITAAVLNSTLVVTRRDLRSTCIWSNLRCIMLGEDGLLS